MKGRLALTKDGKLTICKAKKENIGKRKCNHIAHIRINESAQEFTDRVACLDNIKSRINNYIILNQDDSIDNISQGVQEKFKKDNKYYKIDTIMNESIAEEFVSIIGKFSNLNCVGYKAMAYFDEDGDTGKNCCVSNNFLKENEKYVPLKNILGENILNLYNMNNPKEELDYIVSKVIEETGVNIKDIFLKTLTMDLLTINSDRHLNNIGLIRNYKTREFKLSPCFDNGFAMLTHLNKVYKIDYNEFTTENNMQGDYFKNFYSCMNYQKLCDFLHDEINENNILTINKKELIEYLKNYDNLIFEDDLIYNMKIFTIKRINELEKLGLIKTN